MAALTEVLLEVTELLMELVELVELVERPTSHFCTSA